MAKPLQSSQFDKNTFSDKGVADEATNTSSVGDTAPSVRDSFCVGRETLARSVCLQTSHRLVLLRLELSTK